MLRRIDPIEILDQLLLATKGHDEGRLDMFGSPVISYREHYLMMSKHRESDPGLRRFQGIGPKVQDCANIETQ